MTSKKRYESLDFLRGVAVSLVMLQHYEVINDFFRGWSGVDLFFVLSGFFISGILFKEFKENGAINPGRFLLRRGLKIWPLFYVTLLLHIAYYYLKGTPVSSGQILADAFFFQNYRPGVLGISWSLGVEEQFYLFMALSYWIIFSIPNRKFVPALCVLFMVLCPILRILNYNAHPFFSLMTHHFPTYFRMDALMFGVLISYFFQFYMEAFQRFVLRFRYLLLLAACLTIIPLFIWRIMDYRMNTLGLTSAYLSYGIFMMLFLVLPLNSRTLQNYFSSPALHWMVWIGQYSYAIYLFHFSFGFGVSNFVRKHLIQGAPHLFYAAIYLLSNIAIGYLASKLVEQPFLRLREKYVPALTRDKKGERPKILAQ